MHLEDYLHESFKYQTDLENRNSENDYKKITIGKGWCASLPFYVLLFKEPIINPVSPAKVKFLKFENNHFNTLEKLKSPTTTPAPTVAINCKSLE